MTRRESRLKCFEILAKAFNCLAALEQLELMWSLNVKCLSMLTPSTLTQFCDVIVVFPSNASSMGSSGDDDKSMNWNLSGCDFMPLIVSQSVARLQSIRNLDKTSERWHRERKRIIISVVVKAAFFYRKEQVVYKYVKQQRTKDRSMRNTHVKIRPWASNAANLDTLFALIKIVCEKLTGG